MIDPLLIKKLSASTLPRALRLRAFEKCLKQSGATRSEIAQIVKTLKEKFNEPNNA